MASESMESLNLTRRYRPKTMNEYIGNDKLKQTILSWLGRGIRPQTILLKGSTGGGKTTMSRLIAKEYLCENRDEEKGACNECASCQSVDNYITTGNTDDLIGIKEINASKDTGIAAVNGLLEEANYPSFDGSWKVYILDECHRLSIAAQNSLLKLVEEPPENVLFMFCTTDPEQMLETLLNRCNIKQDVKKPTENEMALLLKTVCTREGVACDRKGLSLIIDRSELVIRQALMDLENVIVQEGEAKIDSVLQVFDEKPNSLYFEFFSCLLNKDTFRYVAVLHKIKSTMTLKEFVRNLTNFTKRGIYIYNGVDIEGITKNEIVNMKELFKKFSLTEQGILLDFLVKVNEGDLETNLLLLGFKGLNTSMIADTEVANTSQDVIEESQDDLQTENRVTQEGKKQIHIERQNKSNESVKSATEDISVEDAFDFFK